MVVDRSKMDLLTIQLEGTEVTDDIRLAFELSYCRSLSDDFVKISTRGMIKDTFIDTTFENLESLYHG